MQERSRITAAFTEPKQPHNQGEVAAKDGLFIEYTGMRKSEPGVCTKKAAAYEKCQQEAEDYCGRARK